MTDLLNLCKCSECPLLPVKKPVLGHGNPTASLVVVGEAPGLEEKESGVPFTGRSGILLNKVLKASGYERENVYAANALLCRPEDSQGNQIEAPVAAVEACRPRLVAELAAIKPDVILSVGKTAALTTMRSKSALYEIRESTNWSEELQAFVIPTYHPAAILRGGNFQVEQFEDLLSSTRRAVGLVNGKLPYPSKTKEKIDFVWADSPAKVTRALQEIRTIGASGTPIALDTETDSLRFLGGRLLLISMSDGVRSWVLDAAATLSVENKDRFKVMLKNTAITWVLHNAEFDFNWLRYNFGVTPRNFVDTMALALAISEKSKDSGLKLLSRRWLGKPYYEAEVKKHARGEEFNEAISYANVPIDILTEYAAHDALNTATLRPILTRLAREDNTHDVATKLLMPAQRAFAKMSYRGVRIDLTWLPQLVELWKPKIAQAEKDLQEYASEHGFNPKACVAMPSSPLLSPRSPTQLKHFFYETVGLRPVYTKEGKPTTNKAFIDTYLHHPAVQLLLGFRTLDKLMSTFVVGIADEIWLDGRVHPDFLIGGTESGRIVIHNPEMQVLPKYVKDKTADGSENYSKQLRKLFVATPGYVLAEIDFKQLEMRTSWHCSGDDELGRAIMSGDVHAEVAAFILQKVVEAVTEDERQVAKTVNFGTIYGLTAYNLSNRLNWPISKAEAYLSAFFGRFKKLRRWLDATMEEALTKGELQTDLGRKRRWRVKTRELEKHIKNEAVNFKPQSLAADITTLSCIELADALPERGWGYPLFTNQDAIVFELEENHVSEAVALARSVMTTPKFPTCAVFDVDVSVGYDWGSMEKFAA